MPDPDPRDAPLDIVRRLEAELVALERSIAALETDTSTEQGDARGEASSPRSDQPAPLTADEHRRLTRNLEALLEEVRQLADFLARTEPDPRPPKPG